MGAGKRSLKLTWREWWPVWLVFVTLAGLGALGVWLYRPASRAMPAFVDHQDVTASIAALDPGRLNAYVYPFDAGHRADFIVTRDGGRNIAVAFAACRRCYRAGYYRQAGRILCGHCNEPMEQMAAGQTPGPGKDCKQIRIPFEESDGRIIVHEEAVRDTFLRWYAAVVGLKSAAGQD